MLKPIPILIIILISFLLTGSLHIITFNNEPFQIVTRDSFGFSESVIDADDIKKMPIMEAIKDFPVSFKVLGREQIIGGVDAVRSKAIDAMNKQKELYGISED